MAQIEISGRRLRLKLQIRNVVGGRKEEYKKE